MCLPVFCFAAVFPRPGRVWVEIVPVPSPTPGLPNSRFSFALSGFLFFFRIDLDRACLLLPPLIFGLSGGFFKAPFSFLSYYDHFRNTSAK